MTDFEELLKILPSCDVAHLRNSLNRLARRWQRKPSDIINLAYIVANDRKFGDNVISQLRDSVRSRIQTENGMREGVHYKELYEEIPAPDATEPDLEDYGFSDEEILIIAERVKGTTQAGIALKMGISREGLRRRLRKITEKICQ